MPVELSTRVVNEIFVSSHLARASVHRSGGGGHSPEGQAPLVWSHAGIGGLLGHLAEPWWVATAPEAIVSDLRGVTPR